LLSELAEIGSGSALPKSLRGGPFPLMGANGKIGEAGAFNFCNGFLVGRVGAAGAVTETPFPCWASDNTLTVRALPARASQRYLGYLLSYLNLGDLATHNAQPLITQTQLRTKVCYTPCDVAEQDQIASILCSLDTQIRRTEELIAKLEQIKQGLLTDLLTRGIDENGQLRPPPDQAPHLYKDSPLGRIPKAWAPTQLQALVHPGRPIVYGILMPGTGHPNGVPVIKVRDITHGVIQTEGLLLTSPEIDREYSRSRLRSGDLLFTIRGTIGRTAFVPSELNGANITQDTARVSLPESLRVFVRAYLSTKTPQIFIDAHILGVAVRGINLRDVRRIPIVQPTAHEASEISRRIESVEHRVAQERRSLETVRLLKGGLMDDLLTGCVRVTPLLDNTERSAS
jgi:type I restriction enzyme S subunit